MATVRPRNYFDGPVYVTQLDTTPITGDVANRVNTHWDLSGALPNPETYAIYEITFEGESHDSYISFSRNGGNINVNGSLYANYPTCRG